MHTASRFVYPSEWFFSFPLLNPKPQTKISSIPCIADERNCWVWIPICLLSGAVELPQRALCNCPGEEETGLQRRWFPGTSGRPGSLHCNNALLKRDTRIALNFTKVRFFLFSSMPFWRGGCMFWTVMLSCLWAGSALCEAQGSSRINEVLLCPAKVTLLTELFVTSTSKVLRSFRRFQMTCKEMYVFVWGYIYWILFSPIISPKDTTITPSVFMALWLVSSWDCLDIGMQLDPIHWKSPKG